MLIAIIFVPVFLYGIVKSAGSPPAESEPLSPRAGAAVACQEFVKRGLNDPGSADFPTIEETSVSTDKKDPNRFYVTFNGRAKNGFGALTLHTFHCTVSQNDKGWKLEAIRE
ncbi:hypothetical protein PQH03_06835 [Ralstonia insidiosa]|uniref:hypothetical protein n=1 Tax=Ralstonia insidiosa TaxID=190721 RepID=UPI00205475FB|nr:hypothetical protein [Ralstonia insidiosa]MDE4924340.1 hypothetical protein [Ralstonia insidiosa]UNJ99883.1 hypothetical protein MMB19_14270 [Ralstonia insidiosa]